MARRLAVAGVLALGVSSECTAGEAAPINTLDGLVARLTTCVRPPRTARNAPGMEITVVLAFRRNGEILGRPRVTYETPGASDDDRLAWRTAIMDAVQRCTPLPLTDGLGAAVAGRPLRIKFDGRHLKTASLTIESSKTESLT